MFTGYEFFFGTSPFDFFFPQKIRQKNILVVEDDPFLKPLLTEALHTLYGDAKISWVLSAEAAKQRMKTNLFDLVIADYLLEGPQTGVDLWKYCKKYHTESPLVLISGYSLDAIRRTSGEKLLRIPYLKKPFRVDQCQNLISDLL